MPQNEETFIYMLHSAVNEKKSYVGVTNSLPWRLRQYNSNLVGGARYTHSNRPWRFSAIFVVANRHDALSIEWKIKHSKRKSDGVGIPGKIAAACRFGAMVTQFAQISGPPPALRP
jgi:predicted GIY-YIG superfamily endonuclease